MLDGSREVDVKLVLLHTMSTSHDAFKFSLTRDSVRELGLEISRMKTIS